ncbi:hypothetical protein AUQ48_15020 [Kocuria flava]|uniref:Transglutaminase-like domain-containing protein n=1 Tax=Kocuria flava TaxID=446860 RepID=A0A2N4T4Y5_9MICC|nr:DUF3488 and transglutaminase-like domain-containing protein [Kocuria flava]PLC13287.1 hypothetical protein AUQ48_15020 [Kocuria flava]
MSPRRPAPGPATAPVPAAPSTAAPGRSPAAVLGPAGTVLAATALSLVALAGVLDGAGWVAGALLAALGTVAATAVARLVGLPALTAPLFGAGALVLVLTVVFLREPALLGFVPTPGALARAQELVREAAGVVGRRPAPYPAGAGASFTAALLAGLVALLIDVLLTVLRLPGLSALGVLAVLAVPALVLPGSVGPAGTAAAVLAALLLLAGGRHWGAVREARTAPAPGSAPRALVVGAGVLAVTLVLPGLVPGFVSGAFPQGSGPAGQRAPGVGPLRAVGQDLRTAEQTPVLEHTGEPQLLRVLTLEDFGAPEWFPAEDGLEDGLEDFGPSPLTPVGPGAERTTAVTLRDWSGRWLPLPWAPLDVGAPAGEDWSWSPRDLTVHADPAPEPGTAYEVRAVEPAPTARQLREAPAARDPALDPFRALPADTPAALREAAERRTREARTDFDRALALQEWLRSDEFVHDVDAPLAGGYDAGGMAALDTFLETRTGYSGHFAPAMAVMARELGIPARVAVGYLPPAAEDTAFAGAQEAVRVRPRDAHAWPELWFEGTGWVRFEPTPGTEDVPGYADEDPSGPEDPDASGPDGRPSADPSAPETGPASAPPTSPPTATPSTSPEPAVTGPASAEPAPAEEPAQRSAAPVWLPWLLAAAGALLLVLSAALPRLLRGRRRARRLRLLEDPGADPAARVLAGWAEVEDLAADHGLGRAPAETPRALTARLAGLLPAAAPGLQRLGADVERALYGPAAGTWVPAAGAGDVRALQVALADRPGSRRARWLPPSVLRSR